MYNFKNMAKTMKNVLKISQSSTKLNTMLKDLLQVISQ